MDIMNVKSLRDSRVKLFKVLAWLIRSFLDRERPRSTMSEDGTIERNSHWNSRMSKQGEFSQQEAVSEGDDAVVSGVNERIGATAIDRTGSSLRRHS